MYDTPIIALCSIHVSRYYYDERSVSNLNVNLNFFTRLCFRYTVLRECSIMIFTITIGNPETLIFFFFFFDGLNAVKLFLLKKIIFMACQNVFANVSNDSLQILIV